MAFHKMELNDLGNIPIEGPRRCNLEWEARWMLYPYNKSLVEQQKEAKSPTWDMAKGKQNLALKKYGGRMVHWLVYIKYE